MASALPRYEGDPHALDAAELPDVYNWPLRLRVSHSGQGKQRMVGAVLYGQGRAGLVRFWRWPYLERATNIYVPGDHGTVNAWQLYGGDRTELVLNGGLHGRWELSAGDEVLFQVGQAPQIARACARKWPGRFLGPVRTPALRVANLRADRTRLPRCGCGLRAAHGDGGAGDGMQLRGGAACSRSDATLGA